MPRKPMGRKCRPQPTKSDWSGLYGWENHQNYFYFLPRWHIKKFKWRQRKFLSSLEPNSRVLEVGAADARLAHYVISHSKIAPENYILMDKTFGTPEQVPANPRVPLRFSRSLRRVGGNLFQIPIRGRRIFDKILVPESFFPDTHFGHSARGEAAALEKVVQQCLPLLRANGELYVSYVSSDLGNEKLSVALQTKKLVDRLNELKRRKIIQFEFSQTAFFLKRLK